MTAINAIAPWYGSKRTLASVIAEELGPHSCFWDVFCGSMSVLLGKPKVRTEAVNDLHGDLINLARVIQHPILGPALYRRLRRTWFAEQLFEDSHKAAVGKFDGNTPDVRRAYHYFVASWMGMNGTAGTATTNRNFCKRFTDNGGGPATRWESAVRSIPSWRERLRGVTILRSDGFELLTRIGDDKDTAIYCDPPYLKKGAKYVHDFTAADHAKLATALHRFKKARVVVSYYDHPKLAELYRGWTVRRVDAPKAMANSGKREAGGETAPEVLIINGPSYVESTDGMLF